MHKHYGALHAVDGIDLRVERGEIFGLIGHNGAGKSTLFKMILGLVPATSGDIRVSGATVQGRDFRAARRHLGYLPENVVLYDNLNGLETLHFFARLKGAPLSQCQALLDRVGLAHAGKRSVREYSKGMRQRLGFAQALLGSPRVLFLDEPTNGLDPQAIRDFYATLRGLQAEGVTMVITSHILAELQERVDRLAILSAGRIQALGSVQQLREQTRMPLSFELDIAPADRPAAAQALASGVVHALKWLQTAGPSDTVKTVPEAYLLGDIGVGFQAIGVPGVVCAILQAVRVKDMVPHGINIQPCVRPIHLNGMLT